MIAESLKIVSYGLVQKVSILEKDRQRIQNRLLTRKISLGYSDEEIEKINTECSEFELGQCEIFKRVFPIEDTAKMNYYSTFTNHKTNVFHETVAFKVITKIHDKIE